MKILPTCRSVEVRDGNVLWNVGVWDFLFVFYDSEKKVNMNAIKNTL